MDFRVTIATGESPHQPNNTVNYPRNIRYCGVIWLVSNCTVATERIHVAGGDDEARVLMSVSNGSNCAVTTANIDANGKVRLVQGNTDECAGGPEGLLHQ
jgi:hypothetical protein